MKQNPDELLLLSDVAAGFATMTKGKQKADLLKAASNYRRIAFDAKYGEVDAETAAMTDDELMKALTS